MFTKLRNRLTVIFVTLTLIPVLVIAVTLGYNSYSQSVAASLQRQGLLNDRVSQAIDDAVAKRVNELTVLGNTSKLDELPVADQRGLLTQLLGRSRAYNSISVVDPNGREQLRVSLFATVTDADLTNHSQDALFQSSVKTGKVQYSDIHFDDQTGEPLLTIVMPLTDQRSGAISGVLFANYRFAEIWDLLGKLQTQSQEDLQIFLTDPSGTVVAHANPTIVFQKTIYTAPDQDGRAAGLKGIDALVSKQSLTLANLQFTIVSQEPVEVALAIATHTAVTSVVITLLMLLVAAGIIVVVTRQIVRPIEQLSQVAEAIRDGDLNAQASVTRSDEIGKMAQTFNNMTAQLRQTLEGLRSHVEELEKAKGERERLIRELREASRLKSEFLSTMSHELRTPLNAMIGFTELMMAGVAGALTDKQKHQLGRIHANSLRLLSLIDDVLDLSRIEAGRVEIQLEPFSPLEMVNKITSQTSSLAEKKGLQYLVKIDDALPEMLIGDQARIEHVVINLLSNAFKFTEKGEVELSLKPSEDKAHWTLSVRDTGIGIPPHAQEYIFEEFRQVDGSSRRVYGGSGLGLAICRNLTRLMEGDVRVQSTLGEGSVFTVTLPLKAASVVPDTAQIAVPVMG